MAALLDILIPTYRRSAALAVTLTSLCRQTWRDFRIVLSDQTEDDDPLGTGEVQATMRVLRAHGHYVDIYKHRGLPTMRKQSRVPCVNRQVQSVEHTDSACRAVADQHGA